MGFSRLHVGIQSLEDEVRSLIGRRERAAEAEARVREALSCGFVVSADLIYGLPQQTVSGWVETLARLIDAGIDGISLYALQTTDRNRRFLVRKPPGPREGKERFALFHAAHQLLEKAGFAKNHFVHFARERDRNLYYRHAVREENLLALGPWADGVFGHVLYRHGDIQEYINAAQNGKMTLTGALRMDERTQRLQAVRACLMANAIRWNVFEDLGLGWLLPIWQARGLLGYSDSKNCPQLTATGSWQIGQMIEELEESFK
jgi:oxygen-independent coproporphyrinogen-3 oxidase